MKSWDELKDMRNKKPILFYYGVVILLLFLFNLMIIPMTSHVEMLEIDYGLFLDMLSSGDIKEVRVQDMRIIITPTPKTENEKPLRYYVTGVLDDPYFVERLERAGVVFSRTIPSEQSPVMNAIVSWVLPLVMFAAIGVAMTRQIKKRDGGSMSFGKNTAKIYAEKSTGKSFSDVAGQEEAKESLREIVDFLNNPERYSSIGARLPKGALLVGPPGTGKTLLAKAVAGEAGVPFFALSGSDFVEMFVGVGASRVRDLFKQAVIKAPCIVFIDEIDAIGKSRDTGTGGNDEREQTLNQLLAEMDGFDSSKGVVILAATNRPEVLDKALLRPGRFDRRIAVDMPDLNGRTAVLEVHSKSVKTERVDLKAIARATVGASGADLSNIINEAALRAVRSGRDAVLQHDLDEAVETILAGQERKNAVLSSREKQLIAYHEIGHALVSTILPHAHAVHKVTIVPRTSGALGYTLHRPEEDRSIIVRDEVLDQITALLGGRAAEEVKFAVASTGAANDIERATQMARSMVMQYGMSERFDMMSLHDGGGQYLGAGRINCSPETAARADEEILSIIKSCHETAMNILKSHLECLDAMATELLDKETLVRDEFMALYKKHTGIE